MKSRRSTTDERGTGIVGSTFGACAFLAFVALATHTLVGLYATSVVEAAAWDSARSVAVSDGATEIDRADVELHERLSGLRDVSSQWSGNNERVTLHVVARRPSLLPRSLASRTSLTTIDKTVSVHRETCAGKCARP